MADKKHDKTPDSTVLKLVNYSADGRMRSVLDMLEESIASVKKDEVSNKKAITLFLDTENGAYDISWNQAGMTLSEMIALLDNAKYIMQGDLLFPEEKE